MEVVYVLQGPELSFCEMFQNLCLICVQQEVVDFRRQLSAKCYHLANSRLRDTGII